MALIVGARRRRLRRRLPRRARGAEPRAAQAGQDRRAARRGRRLRAARARLRARVDAPVVHPRRSTSTSARSAVVRRWRSLVDLRDRERGEPHRRPRRARRRLVGVRVRRVHDHRLHAVPPPGHLRRARRASALDLAIVAAAMLGACAGFLWWNAAPAQIFMGDTGSLAIGGAMAGLALLTHTILLLPILGGLYVVETLSVIAQVISFRGFHRRVLRMAPIHHHFEVGRLAGVHGDRAVLAVRRHLRRARRSASSTPTSSASPGCSTDARARDRPRRRPAMAVVACTRAAGDDVTVARGPPGAATRTASARGARGGRRRDACSRRPTRALSPTPRPAADLVVPSPGVRPDHPGHRRRARAPASPVRSEIDLAAERLRARADAPRSSRSPAPTARRR